MPRKPTGNCRSVRCRPFSCSPFARSVVRRSKVKRKAHNSKLAREHLPSSSGDRIANETHVDRSECSGSSSDEESDGNVQADFEFFDPKPSDFHGVKILLQTYLDNKQWDLSDFVDIILGQTTVGTVVKIENDEDDGIYSVVTALNLGRYKDVKCVAQVKDFLLKSCQEKHVFPKLSSFLGNQAKDVGLVVSQRVVNLPPQLLPPLYDALFDEVSWATEDEPTEELRNSFRFKFYLVFTKMYKHKNADKKIAPSRSVDQTIIYLKAEDEIFHELSSWSFTFPLHTQLVTTDELKDYRLSGLVMAVDASKIPTFRQQLHSLIDES